MTYVKVTTCIIDGASVKRFVVIGYEQDEHVIIKESNKITLTCEIDSNPESTVKIITPNGTEMISTGTNVFEYNHFTRSCVDSGTYTCYGSNDYNYGHPGLAKLTLFVKCMYTLNGIGILSYLMSSFYSFVVNHWIIELVFYLNICFKLFLSK